MISNQTIKTLFLCPTFLSSMACFVLNRCFSCSDTEVHHGVFLQRLRVTGAANEQIWSILFLCHFDKIVSRLPSTPTCRQQTKRQRFLQPFKASNSNCIFFFLLTNRVNGKLTIDRIVGCDLLPPSNDLNDAADVAALFPLTDAATDCCNHRPG